MSDAVKCRKCSTHLITSPSDVCFYVKSPTEVHLCIKHERRIALLSTEKLNLQQLPLLNTKSKKLKVIALQCGFCENKIGSEMPWGPHSTPFIAFSLKGTVFFNETNHRPNTKARDVLSHDSYKRLEVRTHENFIPDLPPAVRTVVSALLPSNPLHLPSLHDKSLDLLSGAESTLTATTPRPYQITSYLTAIHQNSICVLPTGCGKTLIAALLIAQLKKSNPTHLALFLVDRIPLVFQQSHVLATETGLRVCPLCGENKTQTKVRELNDGRYDVLVSTAGCFLELASKMEVDGRQFCVVVFDECHHSKKGHGYVKILEWLREEGGGKLPRILGLTASPVSGKSHPQMVKRLNEMSRLFHDAVLFAPEIPDTSAKVTWVKMTRDGCQDRFCLDVIKRLQVIAEDASRYLAGGLNLFSSDLVLSLDELLQPSTLGRLRGLTKRTSEDFYTEPSSPLHSLLAEMTRLFFCLELADVMGVKHALLLHSAPIARSLEAPPSLSTAASPASNGPNHISLSQNQSSTPTLLQNTVSGMKHTPELCSSYIRNQAAPLPSNHPPDHISPRLKHLTATLLQNTNQRILIIVQTRSTARDLTTYLQSHTVISTTFHPLKIVGHGGYDGMAWADEQSAALGMFRRGESRLVVSTSVLEEGLDVPECDLVIRMQGVTSLIGFVQSRGRARKEDSRMMVVVNEWEKRKADEMREQEVLARLAIRTMTRGGGVVEEYLRQFTPKNNYENSIKKKRELNLNPVVTLRVWIPNLDISHLRRCANLEISDNIDEIELVECALTRSFEKAGLSAIRVFRIDKLTNEVGIDCVFDSAMGYLVGIADITCLSEEGDLLMDSQAVTSCEMLIRDSWHYKVDNVIVWVTPSVGECSEIKNGQNFEGCECSLGIWDDCSTFTKRYHIDNVNLVTFEARGGIQITHIDNHWIHVSMIIIQDFILIDWNEHGTGNVNMFIPLGTAPTCYYKEIDLNGNPRDHRNCNTDDPILRNLGMNNVLCITFPSHIIKSEISKLRHSHLTHSVFDTRVTIFDGMHDAHHDEFTIDGKNYHENQLPTFTSDRGETRDVHWLLLVLFSLRKGCFTPKVKTFITSFVTEKFNTIPLGELTPTGMQMSGNPIHAIIHALTCCQTIRYWSNAAALFSSSYDNFIHTSSNCDVVTYDLATHKSLSTRQNEYKMYSVVLTPTRIMYLPLQYTQGSRLFQNFGSSTFITVTFRDEQNNILRGEALLAYVQSYITKGVTLAGRLCCFFSATSNQLRTQKATFLDVGFLPGGGDSNADVAGGLRAMREQIVQPDGEEVTMAKYLSCLALFGTTCRPTVKLLWSDVIKSPDVMTSPHYGGIPTALTDGAGKISRTLGKEITECLDLDAIPAAFQIRWAGAKGVVVVVDNDDSELKGQKMLVRPSMLKFRMGTIQDWTLGVVSHSRWLQPHLNREIITLLTSVRDDEYIPEGHIYRLQEEELKIAYRLFTDQDMAMRELDGELNQFTKDTLKLMKDVGVPLVENPFFEGLLRAHYRNRIRMIVNKTRIPFNQGSLLMGIPDPIGILKEGEVYVSIDPNENTSIGEFRSLDKEKKNGISNKKLTLNQDVTIWRNPCLHPGDVRTVKAVSYRELKKWKNVVIFPNKMNLKHNIPLQCSGGDLDGDLFYVLWDKTIIQPSRCNVSPLNYESFGILPHEQAPLVKKPIFDNANLSTFVHDVYSNDTLGQVATMHLALCDVQKLGARDEIAMELAKAQSYAVDFPKTGVPPEVPIGIEKILKGGYPDFMRRPVCYASSKPLGHCYRRAASFDVNYQRNSTFNLDGITVTPPPAMLNSTMENCLNIPGSSTFTIDAQSACKAYVLALNRIKMSYGLRSESEVFLGRGTHWHPYISNRGNASNSIRKKVESLQRDFRLLFCQSCPPEGDTEQVASAWFQEARKTECWSLELIVAREVYGGIYPRIASLLSHSGNYPMTRIANAICYYFQETKLREQVSSLAEPKLAALELLQHSFVENGKNTYVAQPFGSFALGFLDHDSDIDIFVLVNPTHPDHRCIDLQQNAKTKQSHYLDKISPLIESHVEDKVVVHNTRVPIIRCTMPSSLQSTEKVSVDIVCDASGFLKSLWLHKLFKKRRDLYIAFVVLTLWARAAGFVKKDTFQDCVIDFRLLNMGEFHVTIIAMLQEELNDSFEPMVAPKDVILDLFFNADQQRQNSHGYRTLVDIIDTRDEDILGSAANLIVIFCERINNTCQKEIVHPITFVWKNYLPLVDTVAVPSETVSVECIRKLELHTAPSLHCLLSHSNIKFFLEVAAGETEIESLTRKLPLNLSYRISGAIPFHEQRLSMISGAEVTLQEEDCKAFVILAAKGSRKSIQILKEELNKCANMSWWGCRSWVQSSRYFMEGSSFLVVNGVDDVSTNIKFVPSKLLQQVQKLGSHNEVSVVTVHNKQNVGETDYSKLNNVGCILPVRSLAASLRRQVAKMPDKARFEWISFTVSFGSFVALNISESLPETSITLSIDELLQGMNKNGRKRKHWERQVFNANNHKTDNTPSENMKKKRLTKTQPSVPWSDQRHKVRNKRKQRAGIRTTFFPSFIHLQKEYKLEGAYQSALEKSGFTYRKEMSENEVKISSAITRGFEVQLTLKCDSSNNFRVTEAVERSLNWVHGTILGSGINPDARIRLQTTNSINKAMQNRALPSGHVPIVLRPDGTIGLNNDLTEDEKRKVVYVRHVLKTIHYDKSVSLKSPVEHCTSINARISLVREYVRIEDGTMVGPSDRCELRLDFDHNLLFKTGIDFEELAKAIVYATNGLANALKNQVIL